MNREQRKIALELERIKAGLRPMYTKKKRMLERSGWYNIDSGVMFEIKGWYDIDCNVMLERSGWHGKDSDGMFEE